MTQITTTLERIKEFDADEIEPAVWLGHEYQRLVAGLGEGWGEDEPIPYARVLEISGLRYAVWCLRVEPQHERLWRLMAVRFAREVQHLMEDQRRLGALNFAEMYANGATRWLEPKRDRAQAYAGAGEAAHAEADTPPPRAVWAAWAAADAATFARKRQAVPPAVAAAVAARWAAEAGYEAGYKSSKIEREQKKIFLEIVGG